MYRKPVVLAILGLAVSLNGAHAQETLTSEYVVVSNIRLYTTLRPSSDQQCAKTDYSAMIHERAKIMDQMIIGEAFVPNRAAYVYWLLNRNASQEVFYTSYIIRNCVVTENRKDFRQFYGKSFDSARDYYSQTLKQLLE